MILKHTGLSKKNRKYVIGYAVRYEDNCYIIDDKGIHTAVIGETVRVYTDGTNIEAPVTCRKDYGEPSHLEGMHRLEEYFRPGCLLGLQSQGARYLEDLQDWTDKDYEKVRNIGVVKKKRIKDLLVQMGLRYSGT